MLVSDFSTRIAMFAPEMTVHAVSSDGGNEMRWAIERVGHHRPEAGLAVELFVKTGDDDLTGGMTITALRDALAALPQDVDTRVAVTTDQGHHRVLSIHGIGFANFEGPAILDVFVEPWDSLHQVIRSDE